MFRIEYEEGLQPSGEMETWTQGVAPGWYEVRLWRTTREDNGKKTFVTSLTFRL